MEQMQCKDCKAIMARLCRLDFAINELALYLDSYPDNPDALDYYRKMRAERFLRKNQFYDRYPKRKE